MGLYKSRDNESPSLIFYIRRICFINSSLLLGCGLRVGMTFLLQQKKGRTSRWLESSLTSTPHPRHSHSQAVFWSTAIAFWIQNWTWTLSPSLASNLMHKNIISACKIREETRKDHVRTKWEGGHPSRRNTLPETKLFSTMILDLQSPELWENKFV